MVERLNLSCPACGSTQARKLSLIYEEGRTTSQGSFESVGTFNTVGRQKITTTGSSHGIHQTDASKAAAPPTVPEFKTKGAIARQAVLAVGTILGVLLGAMVISSGRETSGLITILVLVLGSIFYAATISKEAGPNEFNEHRNRHREAYDRYAEWEKTFACSSCGERYIPSSRAK